MADPGVLASILTVLGICILFVISLYFLKLLSAIWKSLLKDRVIKALKRRRNNRDPFRELYGYSWDYVIVFKVYEEEDAISDLQVEYSMRKVMGKLGRGGLETRLFYSLQRREVFVKIRCPLQRLQKHADLIDYELLFDRESLRSLCKAGREGLWDPVKIPDTSPETAYDPYDYIYGRYEYDEEHQRTDPDVIYLYRRWPRLELNVDTVQSLDMLLADLATQTRLPNDNSQYIEGGTGGSGGGGGGNESPSTKNPLTMPGAGAEGGGVIGGEQGIELSYAAKKRQGNKQAAERKAALEAEERKACGEGTDEEKKENDDNDDDGDDGSDEIKMTLAEESKIFRGVDRMKLIQMILSYGGAGGCGLDLRQLAEDDCILAYYPLHDFVELRALEANWLTVLSFPWNQPIDQIKNYLGEKVALYFLWLGLYDTWLMPAAVLGFIFWVTIAVNGNDPSSNSVPIFAGLMGLWSALFLEHWKRLEKTTAMKWGMVGFEEEEQDRPQYYGEPVLSAIDGKPAKYFSRWVRSKRAFKSNLLIGGMVLCVIGVVICIFAIRIAINFTGANIGGVGLAGVVSSILLALQIQFLNKFFGEAAIILNDQENHRTDTEYEDALIAKTFVFQFVNSFISLFYIAFIKPFMQEIDACSHNGDCMSELQTTLGTIFLMRLISGNLMEVGLPMFKTFVNTRKQNQINEKSRRDHGVTDLQAVPHISEDGVELAPIVGADMIEALEHKYEMSEVEIAFAMPAYDVMMGPFEDFAEMVIQFGYTTMFVAAFPLATVMSFANNYVEIRVDAWKLCHLFRRVEPRSIEDIGTWYVILEIVSNASIFINAAIVSFTATNTVNYTWVERIWIFILMASGLFAIRSTVAFFIPDVPVEVDIQLARQDYITGKVLDNIEDEDENAHFSKTGYEIPNFLVGPTDDDPM